MNKPEQLYKYVRKFFIENKVTCEETISQVDRIRELHDKFMFKCFKILEDELQVEEENEDE